jgi:hypothetical protein
LILRFIGSWPLHNIAVKTHINLLAFFRCIVTNSHNHHQGGNKDGCGYQ